MLDGRITKGVGGLYTVATEKKIYSCKARGIFRKDNITPMIGDFVKISIENEEKLVANIEEILERKNFLIRPKVSNLDLAILVFSIKKPDINIELLDKFLVVIEEKNIEAVICFNKTDLCEKSSIEELRKSYEKIGYKVVCTDIISDNELDTLKTYMRNKVSVFAGPSGVGKSSIINRVCPSANMEIGELSKKIQRGKHTTRHAELMEWEENSFIVDSPGFTTLTLQDFPMDELSKCFIEFEEFSDDCRFSNCIHMDEPNCAVKTQVGKEITEERYKRYLRFIEEINSFEKYK